MVILHILAPAEAGGLERVVHALAIGHQQLGHEVHVAAVIGGDHTDHPFLTPLRDARVDIFPLHLPPRRYLRERALVASLCRRLQPAVVHTHGYRADVVDAGLAGKLGIPTVTTVHGFTRGGWKNRAYEWMQCAAFRRFDAVVAVSGPLAQRLAEQGVQRGRIHVIPNAWGETSTPLDRSTARRQLAVPNDLFHIGWVGRLSREKGPDVLVDALPNVSDLPLRVSVLGSGREQAALREQAAALGLDGRIRWWGTVQNAGRLFRAFDVFVLSSRTEGTPIVLFEAMAAGVPTVATQVGGVPDVVSTAEALLVRSEDPGALAQAIRSVYRDNLSAAARAKAAQARLAEEFARGPWLARYEAIYRQIQRSDSALIR